MFCILNFMVVMKTIYYLFFIGEEIDFGEVERLVKVLRVVMYI